MNLGLIIFQTYVASRALVGDDTLLYFHTGLQAINESHIKAAPCAREVVAREAIARIPSIPVAKLQQLRDKKRRQREG